MPRPRLILVLGDQLTPDLTSLAEGDPDRDRVVMAEVREEAEYVPHHRKKMVFLFTAMRHFAARLRRRGWTVDYHELDRGLGDLCEALRRSAEGREWVELPNTLGMVMHADGGYLGSKPYAASGKYIQRMSDYCAGCAYKVSSAEEDNSCPFNSLYWHFIQRHRRRFETHPRMSRVYRNWERMDGDKRRAILARADRLLKDPESL